LTLLCDTALCYLKPSSDALILYFLDIISVRCLLGQLFSQLVNILGVASASAVLNYEDESII
jgi:hypothetical protein